MECKGWGFSAAHELPKMTFVCSDCHMIPQQCIMQGGQLAQALDLAEASSSDPVMQEAMLQRLHAVEDGQAAVPAADDLLRLRIAAGRAEDAAAAALDHTFSLQAAGDYKASIQMGHRAGSTSISCCSMTCSACCTDEVQLVPAAAQAVAAAQFIAAHIDLVRHQPCHTSLQPPVARGSRWVH